MSKKWPLIITLSLILFYLATHLFKLTALPVFADESIYIRWTQLMIDDFPRYALFPLNDGKTPLQMWLMIPFQYLFSDQLFAGRFLSVLVGLAQLGATAYLLVILGARKKTVWLGILCTTVLPYWFFHHRMALIDALLTLWLSISIIGWLQFAKAFAAEQKPVLLKQRLAYSWLILAGIAFGLALLTKLTALLFVPVFALYCLFPKNLSLKARFYLLVQIGAGSAIGVFMFGLLSLHPSFGQLFSRGSDFLYPWQEVFFGGKLTQTLPNIPTYIYYFLAYLTPTVVLLSLAGLFLKPHQRTHQLLFWSAVLFVLPIGVLGKVVYPRYLLPAALFLTVSAALAIQTLFDTWVAQAGNTYRRLGVGLFLLLLISNALAASMTFMTMSVFRPDETPFVEADRSQYLTEWSSGHGIKETVNFIHLQAATQPTAVATEGFFGTLPDGILLYLHGQNVDNLYVEGIGQPVITIPETFKIRAAQYERVLLVVNSHRLKMSIPAENLLQQYCRPYSAPCLEVWDITEISLQRQRF